MLLLCITGLPLIFHEEIDDVLHSQVKPAEVPPGTPQADLDKLLANAMAQKPGQVPHFLIWDRDDPNAMFVSVGPTIASNPVNNVLVRMDAHTGAYLDSPDVTGRFTYIMLKLHTDMFAGLPGKLFLGLMVHPDVHRDHLGNRRLCVLDAQAELRHLPREPHARRALARCA